jgi:rare lipoprotein A
MKAFTAAHRRLPFGSIVTVTHVKNGRSVKVRINDRGPFIKGRVIDLSYAAAKKLGMLSEGVARVRVRWKRKTR